MTVDDVSFALLKASVADLREETHRLENEVAEMKKQDQARLRAGVLALGGVVLSLITYIWSIFSNGGPT